MQRSSVSIQDATPSRRACPLVRGVCFALFIGVGLATFAGVVSLPEWADLTELKAQHQALAHHLDCEKRLAVYNERLIHSIQTDPVLAGRVLMRHGYYQRVDCQTVAIEPAHPAPTVPARLLDEAGAAHARADDSLSRAGRWLADRPTALSLMALSVGMIAAGVVLFGPRGRTEDA